MGITVSVVLCSYNGVKYIKEQIDSILNQSYPIMELIIQDDGSTDGTWDVLSEYRTDPRVFIYTNNISLGFNANFTTAIMKTKGDYIACSDQDDIWKENKIEELVNHINGNVFLFHDSILFTTDIQHSLGKRNLDNQNLGELFLLLKPYIPGHQCFFSKKILSTLCQLISLEPDVSYDSIIALTSKIVGEIEYLNIGLVYWRRHSNAFSYVENPRKIGKLKGFVFAITALFNKQKREITKRYFMLLEKLPFKENSSFCVVKQMKKGSLNGIINACFICLKYRKSLFPNEKIYSSLLKTFFLPIYFIRDCSEFVIKGKA